MSEGMLGLRTAKYDVPDSAAAKKWYAKAFRTEPYFDEVFYVGFNIGGYELGLTPDNLAADKKARNMVAYWGVDDVKAEYERLLSMGGTEGEAPTEVGGDIVVAEVLDPWGNAIGLIYNPHFALPE